MSLSIDNTTAFVNTSAAAFLRRGGGTRSRVLLALTCEILEWVRDITLFYYRYIFLHRLIIRPTGYLAERFYKNGSWPIGHITLFVNAEIIPLPTCLPLGGRPRLIVILHWTDMITKL